MVVMVTNVTKKVTMATMKVTINKVTTVIIKFSKHMFYFKLPITSPKKRQYSESTRNMWFNRSNIKTSLFSMLIHDQSNILNNGKCIVTIYNHATNIIAGHWFWNLSRWSTRSEYLTFKNHATSPNTAWSKLWRNFKSRWWYHQIFRLKMQHFCTAVL